MATHTGGGKSAAPIEGLGSVDIGGMAQDTLNFIGRELALNTPGRYILAAAVAVGGIALVWLIRGLVSRIAAKGLSGKGKSRVDRAMAEEVGRSFAPLLYLVPLYCALNMLKFSAPLHKGISFIILVLFITRGVRFLSALASFATDAYLRGHSQSLDSTVGRALSPIIRVLFWTLGFTIILDNMGFQMSSLLAGLGIVGVAVGLAGQTILGDFFGYLVIIMDRPFAIGDYISAGEAAGTVESIGLKTTRLRTTSGEVTVCPNGDLTKQRIANYRLMHRRQRTIAFGVSYATPLALLRSIPDMVRDAVAAQRNMELVRVYLSEFGESSINFQVVFSVGGRDMDEALALQQDLSFAIMDRFAAQGISFAHPARVVHYANAAPQEA